MESLNLTANGIAFHALADGPSDGPLVLCLHGFPELGRSWRHQLPALAAAGYRAVAPDLRGYGGTELQGPYDLRTLVGDVENNVPGCPLPSGTRVSLRVVHIFELDDGRIIRENGYELWRPADGPIDDDVPADAPTVRFD